MNVLKDLHICTRQPNCPIHLQFFTGCVILMKNNLAQNILKVLVAALVLISISSINSFQKRLSLCCHGMPNNGVLTICNDVFENR